ncbi:MAG: hypothetical protein K8R36_16225 [Planctomycetales bacterium]|nr:hypothetical protein [Planctomycetales bacterium]
MKYSLRSLMIAVLTLPPLLAVGYFFLKASNSMPIPLVLGIAIAVIFISMRIAFRGDF